MSNLGKLYLISTPIGNLEDITLRALRILKEVDLVAAEDTRRTSTLLNHFEIKVRTMSYHAHNEHEKTSYLIEQVQNGLNIAIVSDAGTPAIADPGFLLVREAFKAEVPFEIIPGVSALTFAASGSALPVDKFSFKGFAPVKQGQRKSFFENIANSKETVFFFESPYRISKTLDNIVEYIGENCQVSIIREATKLHEEIIRGEAITLNKQFKDRNWKGEFVIGVYP